MVSFQCNNCQDVVKKPKLDSHSYRCHDSFTCVDCSDTFSTPAEWKGHTSCITEAEKYQKSLYKGKKSQQNGTSGPRGTESSEPASQVSRKSFASESVPAPRDEVKENLKDGAPVSRAEGNSGVSAMGTVQGDEVKKEKRRKRKLAKSQDSPANDTPTNVEAKEKKKRKSHVADDERKAKTDGAFETNAVLDDSLPLSTVVTPGSQTTSSKKKTKRKDRKNKVNLEADATGGQAGAPPVADSQPYPTAAKNDDEAVSKKKRKHKDLNPDVPMKISSNSSADLSSGVAGETPAKKKRKDKSKKEREGNPVSSHVEDRPESDKGRAEKRKRSEGDETMTSDGTKKAKKRKEKGDKMKVAVGPETDIS